MAKNTYNKSGNNGNSYRKEKEPEEKKSTPKRRGNNRWERMTAAFSDPRMKLSLGLLLLFLSFFLSIAFISYLFTGKADQSMVGSVNETPIREAGAETENWLGVTGAFLAHWLIYKWFGIAAFLLIPILFLGGYKIVFKRELFPIGRMTQFSLFTAIWLSSLLGYLVLTTQQQEWLGFLSGGIGYELASFSHDLLGWGTLLLIAFALVVFIIYFFNVTTIRSFNVKINETIREIEEAGKEEVHIPEVPVVVPSQWNTIPTNNDPDLAKFAVAVDKVEKIAVEKPEVEPVGQSMHFETNLTTPKRDIPRKPTTEVAFSIEQPNIADIPLTTGSPIKTEIPFKIEDSLPITENIPVLPFDKDALPPDLPNYDPTLDLAHYQYPSLDLLDEQPIEKAHVSVEELEANKDKIVETLGHYGIGIASIKATIGPTVTLYEIIPEAGIRISKIKSLEDDIALSLAALGIRIIAPIPGKGTIGIEVPNKKREMVSIKSVMLSPAFQKSDKDLPVVMGKTISNEVFVTDLSKMPHLLMAGATGQGKSVGLNVVLASLIYKKHPSELKFVLVDPKKVELTLFNKIERHFLAKLPGDEDAIITDTKKVVHTLNSLCVEMDLRYDLLRDAECRNLKEYNTKFVNRRLNPEKGHRFLPYIVLVVDELADLMMTAGKEVEQPIARLAQLARAIGIHLVVATQRPSVNVITGIIKANFPARLSFKVTSKIDSRTILDTGGADQLVGQGDMLLMMGSEIIRLQCPFVKTEEVERICDFVGGQRGYPNAYQLPEFEGDDSGSGKEDIDLANRDSMFEEAARIIVQHQQGSTSLLQRRLKLGYNRAGRLIDQLEAAGIVGPFEGSKAREVLIPDEYSLEQLINKMNDDRK
ncbi:DNA translocase FtsK [Cytophagaceae bacterium DM2B3-1]|uniref:DNA translocase FtsK n=2 Tax=Bacteria TaxID=2 RepID=A0ABT7CT15_9BACT|nr:DNA translocase FtsK [Xanthocytophaga flavus]MDJ1471952.1 DNA translocase FtsK [Xanthocytophaga flavus]MDJ1496889.1 DNA translocase FtsK [Xanthocytophaga flavus]